MKTFPIRTVAKTTALLLSLLTVILIVYWIRSRVLNIVEKGSLKPVKIAFLSGRITKHSLSFLSINRSDQPANRIDDDHNGLVDDDMGWNFVKSEPSPILGKSRKKNSPSENQSASKDDQEIKSMIDECSACEIINLEVSDSESDSVSAQRLDTAISYAIQRGADFIVTQYTLDKVSPNLLETLEKASRLGLFVLMPTAKKSETKPSPPIIPNWITFTNSVEKVEVESADLCFKAQLEPNHVHFGKQVGRLASFYRSLRLEKPLSLLYYLDRSQVETSNRDQSDCVDFPKIKNDLHKTKSDSSSYFAAPKTEGRWAVKTVSPLENVEALWSCGDATPERRRIEFSRLSIIEALFTWPNTPAGYSSCEKPLIKLRLYNGDTLSLKHEGNHNTNHE